MKEFIDKLISRLEEKFKYNSEQAEIWRNGSDTDAYYREKKDLYLDRANTYGEVMRIVNQLAEEFATDTNVVSNGWIHCEREMPPVETEVWIVTKRKRRDGTCRYITTTAMYEDGTVLENDSCWQWEDIDGEWDEEAECCIIPKGWWEWKHYNGDGELNHAVDDEVIAWKQIAPYQPKGE